MIINGIDLDFNVRDKENFNKYEKAVNKLHSNVVKIVKSKLDNQRKDFYQFVWFTRFINELFGEDAHQYILKKGTTLKDCENILNAIDAEVKKQLGHNVINFKLLNYIMGGGLNVRWKNRNRY